MVIVYVGLELYLGLTQPGSSIAHFAHLGGMILALYLLSSGKSEPMFLLVLFLH